MSAQVPGWSVFAYQAEQRQATELWETAAFVMLGLSGLTVIVIGFLLGK